MQRHASNDSTNGGTPLSRRGFLRGMAGAIAGSMLAGCGGEDGTQSFVPVQGSSSADRAVEAARRFAGTSLKVGWESGPQAQEIARFSGPLWEELTGIQIHVIEAGMPSDQYRRIMSEHTAGTEAWDCASVAPAWMPDLLAAKALEPIDDYIQHYMVPGDLQDYLPLYDALSLWEGRRYGLYDDGDVLLLFYRRDLFEDERNQREFASRYGRPLGDPRHYDWQQFADAARFFTETGAPRGLYGLAPLQREQEWAWFQTLLRMNGGEFFDPETMRARIAEEPGRRAVTQLAQMKTYMPPVGTVHVSNTMTLASYVSGSVAMASFWPPLGRLAEGYIEKDGLRIIGVPGTQVAGQTGYALLPGGCTQAAVGFLLAVPSRSRHKEAAYLFLQWLTSPEISLKRVTLPYSWRDPYRRSHINSPEYRSLWPSAPQYLDTLSVAASGSARLDLCVLGATGYEDAFYHAITDARFGGQVGAVMSQLAGSWDIITDRHGRSRQRTAYSRFVQRQQAVSSSCRAT